MASLKCVVASPEGLVWEGEASSVVVPAADGELGILPRHAPLLAKLGFGELRIAPAARDGEASGAGKLRYFVDGGFVRVSEDEVAVLATKIEALETLSKSQAKERVQDLATHPPPRGASPEEVERHRAALEAARRRARLAPE